jgi:RNA polymerase sigma factor (sigma-70 family)
MDNLPDRVLSALKGLVTNWYTPEIVSAFAHLRSDETQDALCDLEIRGEIEIDEWEDGIRVRLKDKEEPLNDEQKALVEQWIPLAYKMAMEKYDRKWLANEELAQHLCCELINIAKRYDPVTSPNFLTYACPCLKGARTFWYRDQKHLRGFKAGKEYDDKPQVEDMNLNDPDVMDEFEGSFCYDDRHEFELRDEILEVLAELTFEQAQAIILTEYYEMTGDEAAETARTTRAKLVRAKKAGLATLRGEQKPQERPEYSGDFKHLMPKVLVGTSMPWPPKEIPAKKKERKPCPVCSEKPLDEIAYCLYCDRWGMDGMAKTTPRMAHKKTATLKMTKARDKYRAKAKEVA